MECSHVRNSARPRNSVRYNNRPQRSCGQGNIFTPVCHSVDRGGLPPARENPPCHGEPPLPGRTPPARENPPCLPGRPPRDQTPPPPGPDPPPWEADCSIRSTSGRYASYWNAFLFCMGEYNFGANESVTHSA